MSSVDHTREDDGPEALAAEYVLGLLDAEARAAAEARLIADPDFAEEVAFWRAHFSALDQAYAPVTPPADALRKIETRLFGAEAAERAGPLARLWGSLALWRAVAVVAIVLAVAVAVRPDLLRTSGPTPAELVASLQADDSPVHFVAVYDPDHQRLRFNHVSGDRQAAHDFELWVIEGDKAPVSLGVIPAGQSITVAVAPGHRGLLHSGSVLAISSEPLGGSPTGQPTGPVVAAGDMRTL